MLKIKVLSTFIGIFLLANQAMAQSAYVAPLNAGLGNGAAVSCGACHSGTPSRSSAVLPMAITWRTGANLALSDSDQDGFNNAEEVSGGSTNFNSSSITPFTLATGGKALTNVYVVGDSQAVETTGPSTLVITADSQILGNIAVDIYADPTLTAPITLTFKAGGAAATSTVYATTATQFLALAASDWRLNADGSVQIKQLPAGITAATHNILVVRKIPVVPAPGAPRGGGEQEEGCVSSTLSTPLLMTFGLLVLGFLLRRKQV